jgi:hypothetical protein
MSAASTLRADAAAALVALAGEPLLRRRGVYVRQSEIARADAAPFTGRAIDALFRCGLVSIRPRATPRRIEVLLTREGRERAAAAIGARADVLAAAAT